MEVDHGDLHWWWQADLRAEMLDAVSHHFTGRPSSPDVDRVLATVLFTDLVSSTERAAAMGDKRWREILDEHDALIGRELDAHRGSLVRPPATASWRHLTLPLVQFDAPKPLRSR
jgi:class 3 adenylate cyclase